MFIFDINMLGYGGAFNAEEGNSSFLMSTENFGKRFLVDCGSTVYSKLSADDVKNIECVLITHCHDDHIGSLSTLIYNRWFIHNKITTIITSKEVGLDLALYLTKVAGHKSEEFAIWNGYEYPDGRFGIQTLDTSNLHVPNMPSCGFLFSGVYLGNRYLLYSGDISVPIFESPSIDKDMLIKLLNGRTICFHDVTFKDYKGNVHCFYEKLLTYSDKFNIYGYHYSESERIPTNLVMNSKLKLVSKIHYQNHLQIDKELLS